MRLVYSLKMIRKNSKKILALILVMQLLLPGVLLKETATAAPDFTSPYLPEIKSISWSGLSFNNGDGSVDGSARTQFDITARIHRNPQTYIDVYFTNSIVYVPTALEPMCQNYINLRAGDPFGRLDAPPLNLASRVADGDRYTERYIVQASTNGLVRPLCPGEYSLSSIGIYDNAARYLTIRLGGWFNDGRSSQYSSFWDQLGANSSLLPCKVLSQNGSNVSLELCNQTVSSKMIQFSIKVSERKSLALPETIDYVSKLAQSQNQISILTADKTSLQSQVTSLTADKTSLQSQVNSLKADNTSVQSQVKSLTTDKTSLQSQVSLLTSEKSTLQTQLATVTNDKSNLQSLLNALNSDKSALQSQLNNFESEKSALQNQVKTLLSDRTTLQKRLTAICKSKPKPKGC
jgi:hypothetical protein